MKVTGALEHDELLETQAAAEVPVPWQGPSFAVNFGQVSEVPVNDAQGYGATHPVPPPQTQLATPDVGGYQAAQSASLVAVVFRTHVLSIHAAVDTAPAEFVQGMPFPMKLLHKV